VSTAVRWTAHKPSCCKCLQAICFVRPTRENVTLLKRELRQPRYQSYHLCEHQHSSSMATAAAASLQHQPQQHVAWHAAVSCAGLIMRSSVCMPCATADRCLDCQLQQPALIYSGLLNPTGELPKQLQTSSAKLQHTCPCSQQQRDRSTLCSAQQLCLTFLYSWIDAPCPTKQLMPARICVCCCCLCCAGCAADFTNLVSQMHLQDLAEADAAKEQVQQVQVRVRREHRHPWPGLFCL
jgi:hypothetical protein